MNSEWYWNDIQCEMKSLFVPAIKTKPDCLCTHSLSIRSHHFIMAVKRRQTADFYDGTLRWAVYYMLRKNVREANLKELNDTYQGMLHSILLHCLLIPNPTKFGTNSIICLHIYFETHETCTHTTSIELFLTSSKILTCVCVWVSEWLWYVWCREANVIASGNSGNCVNVFLYVEKVMAVSSSAHRVISPLSHPAQLCVQSKIAFIC